jgi:hypothetical protein
MHILNFAVVQVHFAFKKQTDLKQYSLVINAVFERAKADAQEHRNRRRQQQSKWIYIDYEQGKSKAAKNQHAVQNCQAM